MAIGTDDERRAFRLSREVWPSRYELRLALDLDAWTSEGEARIAVRLARPTRTITLHAVELEIGHATAGEVATAGGVGAAAAGASGAVGASVRYDELAQTATLSFDGELEAGEHVLALGWRGPISERLRGLYRSTRPGERYATTQFEMNDARRAFPCFDEPEFKATFAVELVHPAGLAAIANAPVLSSEPVADGRVRIRFAETAKISSYLVAFMVGPFEATPPTATATGWPVRVWAPPGLAEKGVYARDAHARALEWLEAYTGIPYPYTKVDAIGLPDFEAGAMENPGAITYRTTYLAADPSTATIAMLKQVSSVAAHELTHMWWGDLVTMRWWNDLWLNESFASFVGEKCTDALHPEWGYLRAFVTQNELGFGLDALATTHPISTEAATAEEAGERFDSISYIKGQAVLRMIE
ncbi:MAG: M1 family metallopeptidase, partial [Candidatus Limnocylindria bacterium]|nr:M1 family metallopeptidase [Candidatus Limnocylindria bacterium]